MPDTYSPAGSSSTFTVPAYGETADGPSAFRALADSVAAADDAVRTTLRDLSFVANSTTAITLDADMAGKVIETSATAAVTVTVPASSAIPVGTQIAILQGGSGQVTVVGAAGVTVSGTPGLKSRAQYSMVTLIKRSNSLWYCVGDTAA